MPALPACSAAGTAVAVNYVTNPTAADALVNDIRALGADGIALRADAPASWRSCSSRAEPEAEGGLDVSGVGVCSHSRAERSPTSRVSTGEEAIE